ncbi:hypothetical protein [Pseudomarimonas salicorniae]|uniref:Uncharacterized protein n=1 Tax=Pseudomarimonas salicorniae TaxID=2933270 RepID=A0ABT0GKN9_9GAMM|nr:hypothetical protein [Lysobacter sp. CAU 1642]MCK7594585.1 hypothetical protein [Lysobacter sp. CAU 1642]
MKLQTLFGAMIATSCLAGFNVMAQDSRTITFTNFGTSGKTVELEPGSTVQWQSNGDIEVRCKAPCSELSSGGAGGSAPPTSVVLSASPASPASISHRAAYSLTWNSAGADVCIGAESTLGGVATSIANWTNQIFPATRSTPLSLILDGPAVGTATPNSYAFRLRCYGTGGSLLSNQVTVDVAAQTGGGGGTPGADYCGELYGANPPSSTPFNLTRVEAGYNDIWPGVNPGQSAPLVVLPGGAAGGIMSPSTGRYLAIRFVMPQTEVQADQQMRITTQLPQAQGVSAGAISMTFSPCPGDFRPRTTNSDPDPYLRPQCGTFGTGFALNASSNSGLSGCPAPVGKTMYLNIAIYDMFKPSLGSPTCFSSGDSTCGLSVVTQ